MDLAERFTCICCLLALAGCPSDETNIGPGDDGLDAVAPVDAAGDAAPDVPAAPDIPVAPDVPVTPDVPAIPDVPVAPDVPITPDVPATPDSPFIPDVPADPDVPPDAGPPSCDTCDPGTLMGAYQLTYYWLAMEADHDGPDDTAIYDQYGDVIAMVPLSFACALGVEGSGKLEDDRVVNYWGSGSDCVEYTLCQAPYYPSSVCYSVLDAELFPWGKGVKSRALVPFESIAVDADLIPYGSIVYLPDFCGYQLPDGEVSDGCFRADDTGGAIIGQHIDFFSGTKGAYQTIVADMPDDIDLYLDAACCADAAAHYKAVGAACADLTDCPYADAKCESSPEFPGGYCTQTVCTGGDCPDIGGYYAFCGMTAVGPMCVGRCESDADCREGYTCALIENLISAGAEADGCVPD